MAWNLETFARYALPLVQSDLTLAKTIAINVSATPGELGGTIDFTSPWVTGDARVHTEADRRARNAFVFDDLEEVKTPITLSDYVYKGSYLPYDFETFSLTDAGLRDILSTSAKKVADRINSISSAVVGGVIADVAEEDVVTLGATEDETVKIVLDAIYDLKLALDERGVDAGDRYVAISPRVSRILVGSNTFRNASVAGDNDALRKATLGEIAGMTVIQDLGLTGLGMVAYEKYGFGLVIRPKAASRAAGVESTVVLSEDSSMVLNATIGHDINVNADKIIVGSFVGAAKLDPSRSAAVRFVEA